MSTLRVALALFVLALAAPIAAGCSSGLPSTAATSGDPLAGPLTQTNPSTGSPEDLLFVAECANGPSIVAFPDNSKGTVSPTVTIQGVDTTLRCPQDVATDTQGDVIVADINPNRGKGAVVVFPPGAVGDVHPSTRIDGPTTDLYDPRSVVVDALGRMYVCQEFNGLFVVVFAPGSHGDASPLFVISGTNTGLQNPVALGLDPQGNLYVADNAKKTVSVFAPGANGNVAPTAVIGGSATKLTDPVAVAVDRAGTIFVANLTGPIEVYAPGSNGNVAPVAEFEGPKTSYGVYDMAIGDRRVFLSGPGFVDVFPTTSNGSVTPREFTSSLFYPGGIGF